MSMEEWPDDHLDELFRKSAEEYDVPFNADDWADMSRRLDEHDRHSLFDRISRWGGISALLLLLLGGLGWVMYDEKPVGNHQQTLITVLTPARKVMSSLAGATQNVPARSTKNGTPAPDAVSDNVSGKQTVDAVSEPAHLPRMNAPAEQGTTKMVASQSMNEAGQKGSQLVSMLPANVPGTRPVTGKKRSALPALPVTAQLTRQDNRRELADKHEPVIADGSNQDVRLVTENALSRPAVKSLTRAGATYPTPTGNNISGSRENTSIGVMSTALGNGTELPVSTPGLEAQWLPTIMPATSLSSVTQQRRVVSEPTMTELAVDAPARVAVPRLSRLSVMLFASPDLSSIGLKNFERPGSNAGLAIQYQITDRLSINTGAMYSTKRYQTYSSEYVWPSNWSMDVVPSEIGGICKMIDIPLNVRYDWLLRHLGDGRAPARWFASAGLTSYFIQHEIYSYDYENPSDPRISFRSWDNQKAGRPGGSFGFSNLNVSIGYERPITRRLSWQVEPFMKIPLKEVGFFKVKILSSGAFFGLRYRL